MREQTAHTSERKAESLREDSESLQGSNTAESPTPWLEGWAERACRRWKPSVRAAGAEAAVDPEMQT